MRITKMEALWHAIGHYFFIILAASVVTYNPSLFTWVSLIAIIWGISTASGSVYPNNYDPKNYKRLALLLYPALFAGAVYQEAVMTWLVDKGVDIAGRWVMVSVGNMEHIIDALIIINLWITLLLQWRYFRQVKHVEIPEPAPKRKDN